MVRRARPQTMNILHLVDATAGWEQRVAISQLLDKLPAGGHTQSVGTIDPTAGFSPNFDITPLPRRLGLPALAGQAIRRFAQRESIDLIHAWGIDAAAAARAAFPEKMPIGITVYNPGLTDRDIRVLRTIGECGDLGVACAAERVRRRLVEQGVPFEQTVILRPGVDFAAITAAKELDLRKELDLPESGLVFLTPEPSAADDGPFAAVWSAMIRRHLNGNTRIIVPGTGPGLAEVRRLAKAVEYPDTAVFTEDRYPFEHLCGLADYLVIGSTGEVSLTAAVWAMAGSTPIIAPATYATTEILADNLNALLFKDPENWRRRGAVIATQFDRTENLSKLKEVARGQAYEVCSVRRHADQHRQFYDNILNSEAPAKDITDPAMVTA